MAKKEKEPAFAPGENIEFGDRVKDTITGFDGICVGFTVWMHACVKVIIEPEKMKENGKPGELGSFDYPRVQVVKKAIHPSPVPTPPLIAGSASVFVAEPMKQLPRPGGPSETMARPI